MIDTKMLLPGWSNSVRQIVATARHVSAKHLNILSPPSTLTKALSDSHPDNTIWLTSYLEEIQGLLRMNTFTIISEAEYLKLVKEHGIFAIPTMCVLTIKFDGHGNPEQAKSRTVALGNLEQTDYSKGDCYAPVASHYTVRLILCLAILSNRLLKKDDCKNAFVQSKLDELIVVRPPPGYPFSDPKTLWLLNKSLYGLRRAPRYWWDKISAIFLQLNLRACPNEPCYFVGEPLPGHPPIHVVLYVDDFIYFSESDQVEAHFEHLLKEKCVVDFMGTVDYFLGVRFDWNTTNKNNISCKLVQQVYIESLIHKMDLADCRIDPSMTPYRSGLPVDSLPKGSSDISSALQEKLTSIYRSYIGMLTCISTSTRPDIASAVSFFSTYQSCPTQAHIDSAKYVARYLNSTMCLGLLFE